MTGVRRAARPLDIYLQPAVVGGGLGDIEEVLAVGRRLERTGWLLQFYRRNGRPLPRSVDGPWGWPRLRRIHRLRPRAPRALTITPWWGVSAVPDRERSGPPGPWSLETGDIEAVYGTDRVVHLSLEEFARTLTSRAQTRERWREGGVPRRTIARRLRQTGTGHEVRTFHDAYRKWRAFDRDNVLHLYTGFRPSRAFGREFPEAVQVGPLWPEKVSPVPRRPPRHRWVWYASPSTSDRLAGILARAIPPPAPGRPALKVEVRSPHRFNLPPGPGVEWERGGTTPPKDWSRRFRSADLRLVTGSRTLLEALAAGGPFLYFNGVLNQGARTRRHRPEKIDALLAVWKGHGVSPPLRRDLADFSRLRRVPSIARRAVQDPTGWARFPLPAAAVEYASPWDDAGKVIDRWVEEWATGPGSAPDVVGRWRSSAHSSLSRL
jgi:hypothetical protein